LIVPRERYAHALISLFFFFFGIRKLPETSLSPEWVSAPELGTIFNQTIEAATNFVKFNASSYFINKVHYFIPNFSLPSEFLILK
jgi:hypothetical protein